MARTAATHKPGKKAGTLTKVRMGSAKRKTPTRPAQSPPYSSKLAPTLARIPPDNWTKPTRPILRLSNLIGYLQ